MLITKCEVVLQPDQRTCRGRLRTKIVTGRQPWEETFEFQVPDPNDHPTILTRLMRQLRLRGHRLDQGCRVEFMEEG